MEEEWPHLPNEQLLNWFRYPNNPANQAHLLEKTNARLNAKPKEEKFSVVLYAPGYERSSIENFAICEFLASHGYMVLASPSRGHNNKSLEGASLRDIETQARDLASWRQKKRRGYRRAKE